MNRLRSSMALLLAAAFASLAGPAAGQESRGAITGRCSDSSGGVLAGASVTVVNVETNSTTNLTTNISGQYTALYLNPGTYSVTVELQGFRKTRNEAVQVRVGDRVELDFRLEPQAIAEEIEVVAQRPLLESGSATMGQVIDSKLISEIPLGDGTAYGLTRLVPGASFERSYALQRPMDNDNLRGLTVSGTINSEFSIDGSSNVVSAARVGIQPPADAIQEFKVETVVYDAQIGHTGAGAVNLALKSGTNDLHGAFSFFNRDDSRSANLFAANARGTSTTPRNYNRFAATLGGPIIKNKTFFSVSYERLQDDTIETLLSSVPTERMRNGDFSELLARGVQIFDPRTGRNVNGVIVRDPFPGNIIPANRIDPVARGVLSYFPAPNQAGNADLTGNFFAEQPWTYGYDFQMARLDHEWSQNHRTYLRFVRNFRREERYNFAGIQNGVAITQGATDRFNWNGAIGHTAVLSPTTFLDIKANWLRFNDDQTPEESFDPAQLGYSQQALSVLRGYQHIPRFNIESGSATGAGQVAILGGQQNGFNSGRVQAFYNIQIAPTLTRIMGNHTIKVGYDWRSLRQNEVNEGWKGGIYGFDSTYTRGTSTGSGVYGQGIAAFLLGLPRNDSFIETRADSAYEVVSHGVFIHDDWRVNSKLTLNLGVRYDLEQGMTESQNRNVRGFDLTTPNPIQPQVQANYAALPPAGVPLSASQFAAKVLGGYQYLTDENPRAWDADNNNVQPRLGFTYKLGDKTLLRGGAGLFIAPFQIQGVPGIQTAINQLGYSRNTPVPVSSDGLNFNASLSNPVPSGQLLEPVGSSLGLRTNLGGSLGNATTTAGIVPVDRKNPEFWRFSLGVERDLGAGFLVELSYLGQVGRNIPIVEQLNFVPQEFRTQSATRDQASEDFLGANVANPFRGLTPDNTGSNGAQIARRRLLLQYPQFDNLSIESYEGTNRYHAGLVRLEKRFEGGVMVMGSYTYSNLREKVQPLNPWEDLEDRIGAVDRPHRVTFASVAELPFGKNRKWGSDWSGLLDAILGGWQFSAKFEWQTGQPLVFNNNIYYDPSCGDPEQITSDWGYDSDGRRRGVDVPIMDTTCFYTFNGNAFRNAAGQVVTTTATQKNMGNANIRTFPRTLPNFRFQNHHLLDIGLTKNFNLGDRVRLQIRAEALNATNYTLFNSGNVDLNPSNATFGRLNNIDSSTVMKPRDIQLGARLTF